MLFILREFGDNPPALVALFIATGVAFVIGVAYHEACHAWLAHELGDDTAARAGRLTLNPIAHLDKMGTLMFVLVGIGWGVTPVNPWRLRFCCRC